MSLFCCPLCAAQLTRAETEYVCPNGHRFDRAKEGYIHLLPANRMHSRAPGDDKGMALARSRFLSAGYYSHLLQALCQLALKYTERFAAPALLDSGCGEGYYTTGVLETLSAAGRTPRVAGVDLSKPSVRYAARRAKGAEFAVASVYHLPVADESIDLLLNCFSPLALEEFRRVLKPGGVYLYVVPAANHLWELKQVLYEKPYPNPEEAVEYEGFPYLDIVPVEATLSLPDNQTIRDLFQMTPYYWRTPKAGVERLTALETLEVTAAFRIHVFRRRP